MPAAFSARPPGPRLCGCKPRVRLVPVGRGWLRSVRRPVPDRPPHAVVWPTDGVSPAPVPACGRSPGKRRRTQRGASAAPGLRVNQRPSFQLPAAPPSDSPLCPAGLSCRRSPVCPGATRRLPSGKRAHEGRPPACPSGSQSRAPDPSVSDPLPHRRPLSCLSARL